ncbi:MAG: hypothetical protein J6S67_10670 [Methanobrevibacter sp.]|nr:hypothetical protein [Methanobrevibacter sp.]
MSEEEIKKLAKEEFINNVMEQLDSTLIFTYIQNLETQLQQKENIIKEVREYFKNHTLKYDDIMIIKPSDVLEILDKEK